MQDNFLDASEIQSNNPVFRKATAGTRLANYFIDLIIFYVIYLTLLIGVLGSESSIVIAMAKNPVIDRLATMIFYALYMILIEIAMGGRSIGKMITNTKVVDEAGNRPDNNTLFLRNISRAVPFDQLSFLGSETRGWHDKWSNTYVVHND